MNDFSGAASCSVQVSGGLPNVGEFTYTATATDNAGNSSTASGKYRVIYRNDGFLQPVNDTAHTAKNQATYYWRIGVSLDDGQTYYVNIGLR